MNIANIVITLEDGTSYTIPGGQIVSAVSITPNSPYCEYNRHSNFLSEMPEKQSFTTKIELTIHSDSLLFSSSFETLSEGSKALSGKRNENL